MIRMIRMTADKNTITISSMPLDSLYTVRGQDSQCPSTTRMLYGRDRIQLRWTALLVATQACSIGFCLWYASKTTLRIQRQGMGIKYSIGSRKWWNLGRGCRALGSLHHPVRCTTQESSYLHNYDRNSESSHLADGATWHLITKTGDALLQPKT